MCKPLPLKICLYKLRSRILYIAQRQTPLFQSPVLLSNPISESLIFPSSISLTHEVGSKTSNHSCVVYVDLKVAGLKLVPCCFVLNKQEIKISDLWIIDLHIIKSYCKTVLILEVEQYQKKNLKMLNDKLVIVSVEI
jgi:hypothetical protein